MTLAGTPYGLTSIQMDAKLPNAAASIADIKKGTFNGLATWCADMWTALRQACEKLQGTMGEMADVMSTPRVGLKPTAPVFGA